MEYHTIIQNINEDKYHKAIPVGDKAFLYEYKPYKWNGNKQEYKFFVKKVIVLEHTINFSFVSTGRNYPEEKAFHLYKVQDEEGKIYKKVPADNFVSVSIGNSDVYLISKEKQMEKLQNEIEKNKKLINELTQNIKEYQEEIEYIKKL